MAGQTRAITNLMIKLEYLDKCSPKILEDFKNLIDILNEEDIQKLLQKSGDILMVNPEEPKIQIELTSNPTEKQEKEKPPVKSKKSQPEPKIENDAFRQPKKTTKRQKTDHTTPPIETKNSYDVLETKTEEKMEEEEATEFTPQPSTSNSTPRFVRENQEKRERAERKIADEIELQEKRSNDTEQMHADYRDIIGIKNLMEKKIKDHKLYEDYLQGVVKTTNAYRNVNDLLYRYESLIETKTILSEKQQCGLNALEYAQANMMKLVEEKALAFVGLQNQLLGLQERYNSAYAKSLQWESTVSKIQDICSYEFTNLNLVKCSIDHTYLEMCKRKTMEPNLDSDDYQNKLIFIKKALQELSTILFKLKIHCRSTH